MSENCPRIVRVTASQGVGCPAAIRVSIAQGPAGIGLPAGTADAGKIVQKDGATPYLYKLVTPGAASLPQPLAATDSPTFAGLTLSGLPASRLLFTGAGGVLTGLSLGSGLSIVGGALTATATGSGTVTSVGLSVPAGFSVAGSPVTTSGTLAITFAAGYSLPSDATQAGWTTGAALAGTAVQPGALAAGLAGKADLDGTGRVPAVQLPGFVDDVLEFANIAAFPVTGETGKLYISLATNRQYRWSGSVYVEINPSPGSTDAVPEGSVNLYFTPTRGQAAASTWWSGYSSVVGKALAVATDATAGRTAISAAASGAIGSSGLTMATLRILGRTTAGDGPVELINVVGATLADQTLTVAGATDLSYDAATRTVASSTGADAVLTLADDVNAGLMSSGDYLKLLSLTFGVLPVPVYNNTGATIPKGTPVYVTGSSGTRITIAPADASVEATAARTLGLTSAAIANNSDGTVIAVGELTGLNTSTLTEGQIIWLSETTGAMTTTRPTQPAHGVVLGYCVKQGPGTSGIVYVKVDNGLELEELHDVLIASKATGQALMLAADGLWKNRLLVAADLSDSSASGRAVLTGAPAQGRAGLELGSAAQAETGDFVSATTTRSANVFLAGPTTGAAAAPAFRTLVAADLPATAVAAGAYGSASSVATFTVDAQGRLTAAGNATISIGAGAVSGIGTNQVAGRFDAGTGVLQTLTLLGLTTTTAGALASLEDFIIPLSAPTGTLVGSSSVAVENIPSSLASYFLTAQPLWMVATAPAGSAIQFDLRVNGTSIYSTLPTIAAGSTTSAATPGTYSTAFTNGTGVFTAGAQTIPVGTVVTWWILQVGTSTAGAGAKCGLYARRAA